VIRLSLVIVIDDRPARRLQRLPVLSSRLRAGAEDQLHIEARILVATVALDSFFTTRLVRALDN
jgi:hypothetical protein